MYIYSCIYIFIYIYIYIYISCIYYLLIFGRFSSNKKIFSRTIWFRLLDISCLRHIMGIMYKCIYVCIYVCMYVYKCTSAHSVAGLHRFVVCPMYCTCIQCDILPITKYFDGRLSTVLSLGLVLRSLIGAQTLVCKISPHRNRNRNRNRILASSHIKLSVDA
jgi:hypothetical protein